MTDTFEPLASADGSPDDLRNGRQPTSPRKQTNIILCIDIKEGVCSMPIPTRRHRESQQRKQVMTIAEIPATWLLELFESMPATEAVAQVATVKAPTTKMVFCPRCGGSGMITSFKHVKGGECFKCHGSGRAFV